MRGQAQQSGTRSWEGACRRVLWRSGGELRPTSLPTGPRTPLQLRQQSTDGVVCGPWELRVRPKEGLLGERTSEFGLKDWVIGTADGAGTCQAGSPII